MTIEFTGMQRRAWLRCAAGLAIGQVVLGTSAASAATPGNTPPGNTPAPRDTGQVGDFAFLAGSWKISHRRLKAAGTQDWDTFNGEATCWTVLNGAGSIEELRIPARNFSGLGIRLLDLEKHVWSDYWVSGRSGVLAPPGLTGTFQDGVGTFLADDVDGEHAIKIRGVWDRITPTSCRWHQASSRDGGKTWDADWFMDWTRA